MGEVKLYNVQEGLHGRGPGMYSDREEQIAAEKRAALVEGREPDFDNLPPTAGTVLVTAEQLVAASTVNAPSYLDSQERADVAQAMVDAAPVEHVAVVEIPDEEEEVPAEPAPEPTEAKAEETSATKTDAKADAKATSTSTTPKS
jgi:hypothetical protein